MQRNLSLTEVRVSSADTHNAAAITPKTAMTANIHIRINGSSTLETGADVSLDVWGFGFEKETAFVFGEGSAISYVYSELECPFPRFSDSKTVTSSAETIESAARP